MILNSCPHSRQGITVVGLRVVYGRLQYPVAEFVYEGRDENGTLHLWQESGLWRCEPHAHPHPFDLILNPKSP